MSRAKRYRRIIFCYFLLFGFFMEIRIGSFDEILVLHNEITELSPLADTDFFTERIGDKNFLLLVAENNSVLVGYKLGYWIDEQCFYSWLGGVHPHYRKKGIAKKLLLEQERHVSEMGAKEISVKSMNKYKAMLLLLITQNYEITGVHRNVKGDDKILFTKTLNQ